MADVITVFCLQSGEAASHAFSVEIDPTKTVDYLRKLIKAEKTNDFSDIDADKLTLWRVTIPISDDNDDIPILLDNVINKDKKKLGPATRLSKVFPEDLPDESIHIIVQRPLSATDMSTIAAFTVTVKGRTPITLQWFTDTTTTTLDELRRQIYAKKRSLNDGLLPIVVEDSDCSDFTYLETDIKLRDYLKCKADDGVRHISVRLESRPQLFSEITAADADRIYGSASPQPLGGIPSTTSDYTQALDDLFVTLKAAVKAAPPQDESGYSLYINAFLVHAVCLFPELKLSFDKPVSGRRGYGSLPYYVQSKADPSRMLPITVTECGRDIDLVDGIAQNKVQLDIISSSRKRKFEDDTDDTDDTVPVESYGIVTNAKMWIFLQS
ncbi:hypothetical protein BGX33_009960 [Mortierella sp. NVP41]|nr:hypothetical protein BGX33_009960 [Mortierella sp. NVP41]